MADSNGMSFRSAGLGGFNKKDVVAYIQEQTTRTNRQVRELESMLKAANAEKEGLKSDYAASQTALEQTLQQVTELEAKAEKLSALEGELEALKTEKVSLEAEVAALKAEQSVLKAKNEAYAAAESQITAEKAALVQLEMDARLRIEKKEADARVHAAELEAAAREKADLEAGRKLDEVARAIKAFTHFKANANTAILSANEQLKSILALFGDMEKELNASDVALDGLECNTAEGETQ